MKWPKVKLGDVSILKRGKYVTRNSIGVGNIPVILGGQEPAYYCNESNHVGPCIVVSRSGASAGYVSYWDEPIFVTDGFLFEATEKTTIRYLYYTLKANQALLGHMQNGTGIPHVRGEDLKNFEISLPPLPIQQKIASILGAYDDLIENNRRRIELLEKMARELYRERFVRRAKPEMQTRSAEEWFGDISIGKTPPRKQPEHFVGNIPWVSISDMGRSGMFVFETSEHLATTSIEKLRVKVVPPKTLLMSFKLTVGRLAITTCECCTNEAIAHFRVGEEKLPYMYLYLSEYEFQKLGNTCAISDGINSKIVKAMPIDLPDEKVMASFNELATPMFDEMYALSQQNRNLAKQRDRLLPRLMSGKLDVSKLVKEGV